MSEGNLAGVLAGIVTAVISVIIIIYGESLIFNTINSVGISGIAGALLMMALPGSLVVYFLTKATA